MVLCIGLDEHPLNISNSKLSSGAFTLFSVVELAIKTSRLDKT